MKLAFAILALVVYVGAFLIPRGSPWRDAALSAAFALEATAAYLAESTT